MRIRLDLNERKQQARAGAPTIVRGGINRAFRRIGGFAVPILKRHTPTGATNKLRNLTVFSIIGGPTSQRLEIRQSARTAGGAFYGRFVREGTRPHMPPWMALLPWVRAKLAPANEKEARSMAFMVALAIKRRGTKPNPYHQRALAEMMPGVRSIMAQEKVTIIARLNGR